MGGPAGQGQGGISIHAPREGGDFIDVVAWRGTAISIHAPREGGDRAGGIRGGDHPVISIHAPREGGDWTRWC